MVLDHLSRGQQPPGTRRKYLPDFWLSETTLSICFGSYNVGGGRGGFLSFLQSRAIYNLSSSTRYA